MYRADVPEGDDEEPALAAYCPECAGARVRLTLRGEWRLARTDSPASERRKPDS
jgi:hypothetical protein